MRLSVITVSTAFVLAGTSAALPAVMEKKLVARFADPDVFAEVETRAYNRRPELYARAPVMSDLREFDASKSFRISPSVSCRDSKTLLPRSERKSHQSPLPSLSREDRVVQSTSYGLSRKNAKSPPPTNSPPGKFRLPAPGATHWNSQSSEGDPTGPFEPSHGDPHPRVPSPNSRFPSNDRERGRSSESRKLTNFVPAGSNSAHASGYVRPNSVSSNSESPPLSAYHSARSNSASSSDSGSSLYPSTSSSDTGSVNTSASTSPHRPHRRSL